MQSRQSSSPRPAVAGWTRGRVVDLGPQTPAAWSPRRAWLARVARRCRPVRLMVAGLVWVIAVGGGQQVRAQEAVRETSEETLVTALSRLALMDLRASATPGALEHAQAARVFSLARRIAPHDAELLRRQIDAAFAAGEEQSVLELTRELVRLDPRDTVAQLRLITATIAQRGQTVEQRLAEYDTYLNGPRGAHFDESVRSRLALDAALLERERGHIEGFVARLAQAIRLDPTNKEAAALGATFYGERLPDDRTGRIEWLTVLLMADPLDPRVHHALARELAAGGAYESARRFHGLAATTMAAAGTLPETLMLETRILQWHTEGPAAAGAGITHMLAVQRDAAARAIRARKLAGQPHDDLPAPEEIELSPSLAAVAVLAARAAGDDTAVAGTLDALRRSVVVASRRINEMARRRQITDDEAIFRIAEMALQLHLVRLWAGVDVQTAQEDLRQNRTIAALFPEVSAVLDGLARIHLGDPEGGREALEPFTDRLPLAQLGTALACERLGETERAITLYRQVLRDHTLELAGAWARHRLAALGVREDRASSEALDRLAQAVPAWVDRMVTHPRQFVDVKARLDATDQDPMRRTVIRLSIQNLAPVPLALGSDRPLCSRFLLAPKVDEPPGIPGLDRPEVVDLMYRLRLMPRERLDVVLWPDPGRSGWLYEALGWRSMRVRWRVIQGFRFEGSGGYRPGPMCLTTETGTVIRRPMPEATLTPQQLADRIAGDPRPLMPRLAQATRVLALRGVTDVGPGGAQVVLEPEAWRRVAEAWAARYPGLSAVERAAIAAVVPHARLVPALAPFDAVLAAEGDPLPLAVVVLTRVVSPDDPLLSRARESGDALVRELGEILAQRLAGPDRVYARWTPADVRGESPAAASAESAR